jgi:Flp pilus assembly pilin Flp
LREESGATLIEYGLIAALLGVALLASVSAMGKGIYTALEEVDCYLDNRDGPCGADLRAALASYAGEDGVLSESEVNDMIATECTSDCPSDAAELMASYGAGPWTQEEVYEAIQAWP